MIEIKGLTKNFGLVKALDSVSFSVDKGEIVGYVGLNGAGKTTTIRISAGVLTPTSGDVLINGYSIVKDKRAASKHVGWVPERPIFEQDFRALDYFVYLAGYYGLSPGEARSLGKKILEEVGLANAMNRKLKEFSFGMNKRFALAVSMINNPDNYLLDEVLSGLDPQGMLFFRNLALRLKREGCSILFSSHILSEVEDVADKVVFIHKGRIAARLTMDEVKAKAKPSYRIYLEHVDNRAVDVAKEFGTAFLEKNYIVIREPKVSLTEIIEGFAKRGYKVKDFSKVERDLEQVFFSIIGEFK